MVRGWNVSQRVVAGRNVRAGQQIHLAVFGMNGPISSPPTNYVWMRAARLEVHRGMTGPVALEPRGCIGDYDSRQDRYTLHTGLQNPHPLRFQIARQVFNIPETSVRVIPGDVGGSFGMRGGTYNELLLVLWASRLVGRPVKWRCDRSEGFMSDTHGRDNISEVELALDKDGYFLGLRVRTLARPERPGCESFAEPRIRNAGSAGKPGGCRLAAHVS